MIILYHADKVNYYLLIKKGYDQLNYAIVTGNILRFTYCYL